MRLVICCFQFFYRLLSKLFVKMIIQKSLNMLLAAQILKTVARNIKIQYLKLHYTSTLGVLVLVEILHFNNKMVNSNLLICLSKWWEILQSTKHLDIMGDLEIF